MAAKGYWVDNSLVHDMDGLWRYRDANRETMTRYGAKFIIMHGRQQVPEGEVLPTWSAACRCSNRLTLSPWRRHGAGRATWEHRSRSATIARQSRESSGGA